MLLYPETTCISFKVKFIQWNTALFINCEYGRFVSGDMTLIIYSKLILCVKHAVSFFLILLADYSVC